MFNYFFVLSKESSAVSYDEAMPGKTMSNQTMSPNKSMSGNSMSN